MQTFYYMVLPVLAEYLDIERKNEEVINRHLLPEVCFVFPGYRRGKNLLPGKSYLRGKEFTLMDSLFEEIKESFRDTISERETLRVALDYFSIVDRMEDEFLCGGEEDALYRLLSDGITGLIKYSLCLVKNGLNRDRITPLRPAATYQNREGKA